MKLYQHIIFWILVLAFLTLLFAKWFEGYIEAFYYVSLLLPVVMATSYFFNYFLVPRFLLARKFLLFGVYSFYMLVVSLCLELVASIIAMLVIIHFRINEEGPLVTDVFMLALILYFIVLFKSFILLIKHYLVDQKNIEHLKNQQLLMEQGFFTVRSNRMTTRINYEDVLYVESLADYVKIHSVAGDEITSKEKISHLDQRLPEMFLRIHRSFIINLNLIESFSREYLIIGRRELPISRTYRQQVSMILNKK